MHAMFESLSQQHRQYYSILKPHAAPSVDTIVKIAEQQHEMV